MLRARCADILVRGYSPAMVEEVEGRSGCSPAVGATNRAHHGEVWSVDKRTW
jgi:hypothetical protein